MASNNSSPFLTRWLTGDRRTSRRRAAVKPLLSGVDSPELESRLAPATLPQPTVTSPGATFVGVPYTTDPVSVPLLQHSLQVAVDPGNSLRQVAVGIGSNPTGGAGSGLIAMYTMDGGATWSTFLNNVTNPAGRLHDPTLPEPSGPTEATRFDAVTPSVAFDRNGMVYIVHVQRTNGAAGAANTTAATGSGVILISGYDFSGSSPTATSVLDKVLYRWGPTDDAAYNPTVAVDNNVSWTDPASGLTRTDVAANTGVYVAWNTNATTPQAPDNTLFHPNVVFLSVSGNRGQDFTAPLPVSTPYTGATVNDKLEAAAPQIVFSPPQVNAGTAEPAKVNILWSGAVRNSNTTNTADIVLDRSTPVNVSPNRAAGQFQPAAADTFTVVSPGPATRVATPSSKVAANKLSTAVPVTFTAASFANFTLTDPVRDLNVRLGLTHPNMDQVSITLQNSKGTTITLLANHVDNNSVAAPNYGSGFTVGLTGGVNLGNQNGEFGGTYFDDQAARGINDANNDVPFMGYFRPENGSGSTLSQLITTKKNGEIVPLTFNDMIGTWTLTVTDWVADTSTNPNTQFLESYDLIFSTGITAGLGDILNDTSLASDALPRGFADVFPTANPASTAGVGGFSATFDYSQFRQDSAGNPLFGNVAGSMYLSYAYSASTTDPNAIDILLNRYAPTPLGLPLSLVSQVQINDDTPADNFSEGRGVQFEPMLAVDPTTGTLAVSWFDTRFDASNTRTANYVATSIDGGLTFSSQTSNYLSGNAYTPKAAGQQPFLNAPKTATNAITQQAVAIEPIPNNSAAAAAAFGLGTRQSFYFKNGQIYAYWSGSQNAAGPGPMRAVAVTSTGPRVIDSDPNAVTQGILVTPNETADGVPILSSFQLAFDRPISSFTAADITLRYTSPAGVVTNVPVLNPVADLTADPNRKVFTVTLATPDSRVGTYRYTIGSGVRDYAARTLGANSTSVYAATDVPLPVPAAADDASANAKTVATIVVPALADNPDIVDVNVSLDITHTYDADLVITLISPTGQRVLLVDQKGGSGDNFTLTTFDDSAATSIAAGNPPFTGTYRPEGVLLSLAGAGKKASGTWQLEIRDVNAGDTGTLNSWSLTITTANAQTANPLDQNANAVSGELPTIAVLAGVSTIVLPSDSFSTGTVNGIPVAVLPISIPGPYLVGTSVPGGTVSTTGDTLYLNSGATAIDLHFDRAMDPASFDAGHILRMTGPYGPITGTFTVAPITSSTGLLDTFRITFPQAVKVDGPYSLEIVPTSATTGNTIRSAASSGSVAVDNNKNAGVNVTLGGDPLTANIQTTSFTSSPASDILPNTKTAYTLDVTSNLQILQNLQTSPNARLQLFLNITSKNLASPLDVRDITADLVAPDGTKVRLFANVGTAAIGGFLTTFDDSGDAAVQTGSLNTNTTLTPQLPLGQLLGRFPLGTWKLEITNRGTTTGVFNQWRLTLPSATPGTGVGEPVADRLQVGFRLFTQDPTNPVTQQQWTPVGPAGANQSGTGEQSSNTGEATAVAIDPADPSGNTVYIGGASGGLFKTTNFLTTDKAGPTWVALTSFGPTNSLNIGSIALYPRRNAAGSYDPSLTVVYALTGEGDSNTPGVGVIRSFDGGRTFDLLDSRQNINAAGAILPLASRTHEFIGATGYKIVVDPNPIAGTNDLIVYMAISATGSGTNGGLYRSRNSGNTWELLRAGAATDVVLAAGSAPRSPTSRNLTRIYAAFRNEGVFTSAQADTVTPGGFTLMAGNTDNAVIRDITRGGNPAVTIGNLGLAPGQTGGGRITLAAPALADTALENSFYVGWLYAFVSGATGGSLYMTKDFGDSWTLIKYQAYRPNNIDPFAFPTNDEVNAGGSATTPERVQHNIFETDQLVNSNGVLSGSGEFSVAMTVDPNNPNIVYLAGVGAAGARLPAQGSIRLDVTNVADSHAFVPFDNSDNNGGGLQFAGTSAGAVTQNQLFGSKTYVPTAVVGYADYQAFLNLQRDPNNPFVTNTTIQVRNAQTFTNDGKDIRWTPFNEILAPFATSDDARLPTADNVHRIVSFVDPVTRKTRLIYTTDQGVMSGVDNGDGTLVRDGVGGTTFGTVSRNGNLQLLQAWSGAVQPSTFAADIAGALFYAGANSNGTVQGSATIQPGGGTTTILQTGNTGNWTGPTGTTTGIAVDQTGTGAGYQFRIPFEYGYSANSYLDTDFFRIQFPPGDTFDGTISQTSGLFTGGTAQWDNQGRTDVGYFAINPIDRNGGLLSSNTGRLFRNTSLADTAVGTQWVQVADAGLLSGRSINALAFGSPSSASPGILNNFLYAGTQEGNIFVTNTGQGPWTNTTATPLNGAVKKIVPTPYRNVVDAQGNTTVNGREAYAVTEQGVYYNNNTLGGGTWTNITGNLYSLSRTLLGISNDKTNALTTITGTRLNLTSLAVDWRYAIPDSANNPNGPKHPILYVSGDAGVFRSRDKGATWTYFPNVTDDGATFEGGFLPSVRVTDLDLSLGNINPATGLPDQANGGLNMLVATTYGRGQYAIRLSTTLDQQFNVQFQTGPVVTKVATPQPTATTQSLIFFFDQAVDPATVSAADFKLEGPGGTVITPTTVSLTSVAPGPNQSNPYNQYTVTFPKPAAEDFYKLTAGPQVSNFAGNLMNQNGNKINGEVDDAYVRFIYLNGPADDSLVIDGLPTTAVAGSPVTFTVSVLTPTGDVNTGFTGSVHFTSTDPLQVPGTDLPADYTFTAGDAGTHTFTLTFYTAALQTLTVTDANAPNLPSTSTLVNPGRAQTLVTNAPASSFVISPITSPATAGDDLTFTLTAYDPFGNLAVDYTGDVTLTSTDPNFTVLSPNPLPVTFTAADNGVVTVTGEFQTAGIQTVSVTDDKTGSIAGTSNPVQVDPAATAKFVVTGLTSPFNAGDFQTFTVRPQDQYGNNSTDFGDSVVFSSTDPNAVFTPVPSGSFTPGSSSDFQVQLRNAGLQTITVTDETTGLITGSQSVTVVPAAVGSFAVSNYSTSIVAGTGTAITVTAVAPNSSVAVGYLGTIHFTSSDIRAGLPADYTFTIADNGVHTFFLTLATAGPQTVSVNDTGTPTTTGTTNPPITVTPADATVFTVGGFPGTVTAGVAGGLTVTAFDPFGNLATGYAGTVTLTSSDPQAVLPLPYTFTPADAGVHTLPATLLTVGTHSLTATDLANNLSGTQSGIVVTPSNATRFVMTGHASPINAGTPSGFSITAFDAYNNLATTYTGTLHFTSSDPMAVLPPDFTFTPANQGFATFGDTLKTVGVQSITATDTVNASLTATIGNIVVTPAPVIPPPGGPGEPVPPGTIGIGGFPSPSVAGTPQTFTVAIRDGFGNVATNYTGTVRFTSTDGLADLPADYTFTAADAGTHTFTATLKRVGTHSITVTDTSTATLTATQSGISVTPAAAVSLTTTQLTNTVAGTEQQIFVEVRDAFGNLATGYTGSLAFTSTDPQAVLPNGQPFTAADAGRKIFRITLKTAGTQSVSFVDPNTPSLAASLSSVQITGAAPARFNVTLPANTNAGSPTAVLVSVTDAFGNPTTGFTGNVTFTSSDPRAKLPANSPYTNNGGQTFTVTFGSPNAFQTVTVTSLPGASGSLTGTGSVAVQPNFTTLPGLVGTRQFAVATEDNSSQPVKVIDATGATKFSTFPFAGDTTPGGGRVATADFNGDGTDDLVVGTSPGSPTQVVVIDGVTQTQLFSRQPFEAAFTGGVYVTTGDLTGDGVPDLVISPDEGGGPRVTVINGKTFSVIADFFGIDDPNFRGGARSAIGDINGDGVGDLLVAAGFGGGPRVAGFDGKELTAGRFTKLFNDFFAFEQDLRNGVFIAAGDVNGDGFADMIVGGGPGGGPRVLAFSGKGLLSNTQDTLADFFAGNTDSRGGIRVAVKNLDNDEKADIVTGAGAGAGSRVTAYLGKNIQRNGTPPAALNFDAFPGDYTGGVYVG